MPPLCDRGKPALAIEALYRSERPKLVRQLVRRLPLDRAEDIVQQIFARAIVRANEPAAEIEYPTAYLREAARNAVRDQARAAARMPCHPIDDEVADLAIDPLRALEARDRLARLETALKRLKPLGREIFLACRVDGYSYAEIAQRTGLSVKGVEKQMSRAIKLLGHHLHRYD